MAHERTDEHGEELSLTSLWLKTYPNDRPPPNRPNAARAWLMKRFQSPRHLEELAKYEALMAEMKRQQAKG